MPIERIPYGYAANDKKGIDLRNGTIIIDNNFIEIVLWITGGSKTEGPLNDALPISRGGTEATTAKGARENLGLVLGPNGEALIGNNSLEIYNTGYRVYGKVDNAYSFTRLDTGKYRLNGMLVGYGSLGFKEAYPKDELGNVLAGAVITLNGAELLIDVHPVKYGATGAVLDKSVFIDIPDKRFILLNMK